MKALLIIDTQNRLTRKKTLFKEKTFINTINYALKFYRDSGSKIIFIQHNNNQLKKDTYDWEIDERFDRQKDDIILQKFHGNGFQNTELKNILIQNEIKEITICGLVSHGCVKATCLGALKEGFKTCLLENGHTNWNKDAEHKISQTEIDLKKEGVIIERITNEMKNPDSNDALHNMTTEELGKLFPIIIQEPSDKWTDLYQEEQKLIIDSFQQSDIIRIDHIGSTAIPGIKAKPTIDILLQVSKQIDTEKIIDDFKSLEYQYIKQPKNPPPHMMFVKGYTFDGFKGQAYHVHVRYSGDWDEIYFRDYLIKHKEVAKEYEDLKLELAEKFKNDRETYTDAKTDFIEKVNKLARKEKSTNN